jgi:hypothetical protein
MSATPLVVNAGQLVQFDPSDTRVICFDWDKRNLLGDSVLIATSTWTITAVQQSGSNPLAKDNEARLTAIEATAAIGRTVTGDYRVTRVRLDATVATAGDRYRVSNKILTNETPAQTKEQSFYVLVQDR